MTAREKQHNLKSFFKLADPRAVSVDEGKANQEGGGGGGALGPPRMLDKF